MKSVWILSWVVSLYMLPQAQAHFDDASPFAYDPRASAYNDEFVAHKAEILVLEHASVIDGTGSEPKTDQTIVIEDGKIAAVGDTGSVSVPSGAEVVSMAGKTIIPGYVMHHEHLYYHSLAQVPGMAYLATPSMITMPRLYLSAGVITARSIGTYHPFDDLKLKEGIDRNILLGPDFFLTAPFIQGDPKYYQLMPEITSADAATREVQYWSARGFHNFKTYVDVSRSQMKAAAAEAHKQGKNISAHLCSMTILEALDAGIDEIEHGFQSIAMDILRLRKGADKDYQPNATQFFSDQPVFQFEAGAADVDFDEDERRCRFDVIFGPLLNEVDVHSPEVQYIFRKIIEKGAIVDSTLGGLARLMANTVLPPVSDDTKSFYTPARQAQWDKEIGKLHGRSGDLTVFIRRLMELDHAFWRAGGRLVIGSDAVGLGGALPGVNNIESIELLVRAGVPALEVIKIATLNGARALELHDRGVIATGLRADLVVLGGNPVDDVAAFYNVNTVFKGGVGYSSIKLQDSVRGTMGMIN